MVHRGASAALLAAAVCLAGPSAMGCGPACDAGEARVPNDDETRGGSVSATLLPGAPGIERARLAWDAPRATSLLLVTMPFGEIELVFVPTK